MAHKTLIGGTVYNVASGKSMVSGTTYIISGGRTLVGGTGYQIGFGKGNPTAMIYSDGNMVFQYGNNVQSGKTLTASYTGFENSIYSSNNAVPWHNYRNKICNISFKNEISPTSLAYWFSSMNRYTVVFNPVNLNMDFVTNMTHTFDCCYNLTNSPIIFGPNVSNMANAYRRCRKLTGFPVCGNNVLNMASAYDTCSNITGTAVCGNLVMNMAKAYSNCVNLNGNAACGNLVTNMYCTYYNCQNLVGSAVCGRSVVNMAYAYFNCRNLTHAACGNKVQDMHGAYENCTNLRIAVFGNQVTNIAYAYEYCTNITGNAYLYSKNVSNVTSCFAGRNSSNRLNIYVPIGSRTLSKILYSNANESIVTGWAVSWTNEGSYFYNTTWNLYIYPVANVEAARIANGD